MLREQLRAAKDKSNATTTELRRTARQLTEMTEKVESLTRLVDDKQLQDRDTLNTRVEKLKARLREKDETIAKLEKKAAIEEKERKREWKRPQEETAMIAALQDQVESLQAKLEHKERQLQKTHLALSVKDIKRRPSLPDVPGAPPPAATSPRKHSQVLPSIAQRKAEDEKKALAAKVKADDAERRRRQREEQEARIAEEAARRQAEAAAAAERQAAQDAEEEARRQAERQREQDRLDAERRREEEARLEEARKRAEEEARQEAERKREQERLDAERRREQERLDAERRREQERLDAERREADRKAQEQRERDEAEARRKKDAVLAKIRDIEQGNSPAAAAEPPASWSAAPPPQLDAAAKADDTPAWLGGGRGTSTNGSSSARSRGKPEPAPGGSVFDNMHKGLTSDGRRISSGASNGSLDLIGTPGSVRAASGRRGAAATTPLAATPEQHRAASSRSLKPEPIPPIKNANPQEPIRLETHADPKPAAADPKPAAMPAPQPVPTVVATDTATSSTTKVLSPRSSNSQLPWETKVNVSRSTTSAADPEPAAAAPAELPTFKRAPNNRRSRGRVGPGGGTLVGMQGPKRARHNLTAASVVDPEDDGIEAIAI